MMITAVLLFMNVAMTTTRLVKINITSNLKEQDKGNDAAQILRMGVTTLWKGKSNEFFLPSLLVCYIHL